MLFSSSESSLSCNEKEAKQERIHKRIIMTNPMSNCNSKQIEFNNNATKRCFDTRNNDKLICTNIHSANKRLAVDFKISHKQKNQSVSKRSKFNMRHNRSYQSKNSTTLLTSISISISILSTILLLLHNNHETTSSRQLLVEASGSSASIAGSTRFDPISNGYSGFTFTFDPRLDKRVEMLHFEHWLSIIQQTSQLMHETLSGRAHLASIQVLIPYKWRHNEWPVIHKPGVPIMSNRLLKYADSDVIVGFEGKFREIIK